MPILREHLDRYVDDHPDALVFTTATGRRINLSTFGRDVWNTARTTMFPEGSPLRRVRRHDLRHAAITAWLNSGVMIKTCQRWSGHRRASVLLDTYLGVTVDDAELSISRFEDALDVSYNGAQASGEDDKPSQNRRNARGKDREHEADSGED